MVCRWFGRSNLHTVLAHHYIRKKRHLIQLNSAFVFYFVGNGAVLYGKNVYIFKRNVSRL